MVFHFLKKMYIINKMDKSQASLIKQQRESKAIRSTEEKININTEENKDYK